MSEGHPLWVLFPPESAAPLPGEGSVEESLPPASSPELELSVELDLSVFVPVEAALPGAGQGPTSEAARFWTVTVADAPPLAEAPLLSLGPELAPRAVAASDAAR